MEQSARRSQADQRTTFSAGQGQGQGPRQGPGQGYEEGKEEKGRWQGERGRVDFSNESFQVGKIFENLIFVFWC